MFNRSKKGGDGVRKSIQKLLDPKRDSDKRLSNLRHIIDNAQEIADQQLLFCQFYSHIYYVFYENFLLVEQKLKAGHRNVSNGSFCINGGFFTVIIKNIKKCEACFRRVE